MSEIIFLSENRKKKKISKFFIVQEGVIYLILKLLTY